MQVTHSPDEQVKATLDHLLNSENEVLAYWTEKKKQLEQCSSYVSFERSAKQVGGEENGRGNIFKGLSFLLGETGNKGGRSFFNC